MVHKQFSPSEIEISPFAVRKEFDADRPEIKGSTKPATEFKDSQTSDSVTIAN